LKTSRKTFRKSSELATPPPRLKISEWADKSAWIPPEGNAEPGKFRLSRMPHQEEMLDDPIEPGVREIYWMMASQAAGKTMCLILICEFVIKELRRSIIAVRATKETATEWMREKLLPTVRATPVMFGLLKNPRQRDSESTSLHRKFPGGSLKAVGAKSPASFRGSSAPVVLQDEIDSYQVTKEGDACALADRAAITFSDAIKLKCSTPTLKGFSKIDEGHELGDRKKYFLPCWRCGEFQVLEFSQVKFTFTAEEYEKIKLNSANGEGATTIIHTPPLTTDDGGATFIDERHGDNETTWQIGDCPIRDTKSALYVCSHCHCGWTDHQRIQAYMSGAKENPPIIVNGKELRAQWRATAPFNGIRSRHLSGMYLTIGLKPGMVSYLHQFAEDFLAAKHGGRETLMVWTNIFLAIAFEDPHEKMDWTKLKERAEDYLNGTVPDQVVWCAFGADIQKDRVEIIGYGWGDGQEAWCIDHQVIYGDFDMPSMQERVADYLFNKRFTHSVLGELAYSAGGIDSGKQTKVKAVYQFCAKHRLKLNLLASVKGFDQALGAVYQRERERAYGGVRLNFNVDYLKSVVFDRLRNPTPGPRYIHFPKEKEGKFGSEFYLQLCSERRVPERQPRGGIVWHWKKHTSSARNEVLDMTVYAQGIYEVSRQEDWIARKWKEVQLELRKRNPVDQVPAREVTIDAPAEAKIPELVETTPRRAAAPVGRMRKRFRIRTPFSSFR
jgi:phage terminase large subunit GpA-like protein